MPVVLSTLKSLGVTPDFLIRRRYAEQPGEERDFQLLQSTRGWADDAGDLRQQLTDYLGPAGMSVELVCTEHNSVASRPGKQTTSLVNGLFLADSLGQVLQTEFNAVL
jgi:alpha-N-arabinofuranosidase